MGRIEPRAMTLLGKCLAYSAVVVAASLAAGRGGGGRRELRIYVSGSAGDELRASQVALHKNGDEADPFKLKIVSLPSVVKQAGRPTQASVERNAQHAAADNRFDNNGDSTLTRFGAYRMEDAKLAEDGPLGAEPDHVARGGSARRS